MSPLERETKLILAPEDASRIRDGSRLVSCTDQLNIYFHDPARLFEHLGYFRVRFETGREPVATLKIPVGWKGEMREMVEVERPLADLGPSFYPRPRRWVTVSNEMPEGLMEHLQSLGIRRLRRLGWMRNRRWTLALDEIGTVEPGKEADIVVVKKDPLKDIKVLQEGENIALVADLCGFSDQSHFNRHFKKAMGVTPLQYVTSLR